MSHVGLQALLMGFIRPDSAASTYDENAFEATLQRSRLPIHYAEVIK
jgi:hypothetical protein